MLNLDSIFDPSRLSVALVSERRNISETSKFGITAPMVVLHIMFL